jgi:hypothetical protein
MALSPNFNRGAKLINKSVQQGLPLIQCRCGTEILLMPDTKAMDKAIEAHLSVCPLSYHKKNKTEIKNRLCGHLIRQVLDLAAERGSEEKPHAKRQLDDTTVCV